MEERIRKHINNPEKLEHLYREDSAGFKSCFEELYSEIEKTELSEYWKIRLDYNKRRDMIKKPSLIDIMVLISACFLAGFLIKIPDIFNTRMPDPVFYEKNAGIIVFFGMTVYLDWSNRVSDFKNLAFITGAFLIVTLYVNFLPVVRDNDSINLVYIHLPLLMWSLYGLVFIHFNLNDRIKRIEYIRYNGDLVILMAIISIAGAVLSGITIGLFESIGIHIGSFYMKNVGLPGLVSIPIVATYIIKNYPALTNKIAPVIAKIFSPLVLLTAIIYLVALVISGKDLYGDRDFLLMFNMMLLGVMAVIVFAISGTSTSGKQKFNELTLFILSIITVIIDLIALSAILYRLGTFGITPNRLAVLGSNLLILVNLALLIIDLYQVNFKKVLISKVEHTIAKYLPVYLTWLLFVILGFPLIFSVL